MPHEPLNPTLFRGLQRLFGRVQISNEGEAMQARYVPKILEEGVELEISSSGEYYRVCCDRCHDQRFRLWINHRWGKRDERGRLNLWLANCYNEHCYEGVDARSLLYDRLITSTGPLETARIRPGMVSIEIKTVEPPGDAVTLDKLPPDHPANRYLAGRFFVPETLGSFYGVGYCEQSHFYLARQRIYIPVYQRGELKGWQVRYVGDLDWKGPDKQNLPPKYWSCPGMSRGRLLYNYDTAVKYETGVVVEGPADVWAFGPMAMATLGFPITDFQQRLIVPAFSRYSGVLLFDEDVFVNERTRAKFDEIYAAMSPQFQNGLAAVRLPEGTDPGCLDRRFLRRYVEREARAQGVKVSWQLRAAA